MLEIACDINTCHTDKFAYVRVAHVVPDHF
jgi:hypothetical protein